MPRLPLRRLPLVLAAAFLAIFFFVTVWNFSVGEVLPRLAIRNHDELYGVTALKGPPFKLATVMNGDWQTSVSRRIGDALPIYQPAIRLKNQIEYSVFGVSGVPGLAVGREKWIYEWFYINEYCNRTGKADPAKVAAWARKIKDIQDYAVAHGKAFVFVITPSKPAIYPEYMPANFSCLSRLNGVSAKLPPYDSALTERDIHFLDGSGVVASERKTHKITLFPRGGTHWNELGSAIVAKQVAAIIKAQRPDLELDGISTDWTESHNTAGSDSDILGMMNLYRPDANYPVPKIASPTNQKTTSCRAVKIMEVGGSFVMSMNAAFLRMDCRPDIDVWFYWNQAHLTFGPSSLVSQPAQEAEQFADLDRCDVILLDENESLVGTTAHLEKLHDLVMAAQQRETGQKAAR